MTQTTNTSPRYIVQTASAHMPNSCKGIYRRVAVLLVKGGVATASMISDRSKDVLEVVATWERCNVGRTEKCAYRRALAEAQEMADGLNFDSAVLAHS